MEGIMSKRQTSDVGIYDPVRKKFIIYSWDKEETEENQNKSLKKGLRKISSFLSIEKDLEKERFSNEKIILLEEREKIWKMSTKDFYEGCREMEKK